jgi:hypothetical protein
MNDIRHHEGTDACPAVNPRLAATEPSHIHVPRPSRVGRAIVLQADQAVLRPADLVLDEAA